MTVTVETGAQPVTLTVDTDEALLTERVATELAAPGGMVDDPAWLARARRAWSARRPD